MTESDHTNNYNKKSNPKPDKIARTKHGHGKNVHFETIGVVWTQDDGSQYLKPYGKKILDRIVEANSPAVISAYESRISKLEKNKLVL